MVEGAILYKGGLRGLVAAQSKPTVLEGKATGGHCGQP